MGNLPDRPYMNRRSRRFRLTNNAQGHVSSMKQDGRLPTEREVKIARDTQNLISVLLLGSGESGKSTVMKQMMLIYGDGFDDEYRQTMKRDILGMMVKGAAAVLDLMQQEDKRPVDVEAAEVAYMHYRRYKASKSQIFRPTQDFADAVLRLIEDPEFRQTVATKSSPNTQHMYLEIAKNFANFPEWGGDKWIPTNSDILLNRVRTAGVHEQFFKVKDKIYNMIDVGGQRAERRKYLHLFDTINAVLFLTAINEYDVTLFEEVKTSRLVDSLKLFNQTAFGQNFSHCALILFLNKFDLFKIKYVEKKVPLPRIAGLEDPPLVEQEKDDHLDLALGWFERIYTETAQTKMKGSIHREVFCHVTRAIDTEVMQLVMEDVNTHLVSKYLSTTGLLPVSTN